MENLILFWDTHPALRDFVLNDFADCVLIFIVKICMIVFGYRSFEHYLKGNAWRTSLMDTVFFALVIWMQRIIIADRSNPALISSMIGIFIGTFIAAKLRKTDD